MPSRRSSTRKAIRPCRIGRRTRAGGHLRRAGGVCANRRREQIENQHGRPENEHEQRQDHGEHHVDVGEPLDSLGHTGNCRSDECEGQQRDDGDEQEYADFLHPADYLETGADLQCAEAQRCGGAEKCREDREDVDELADRPFGRRPSSGMKAELNSCLRPSAIRAVRDRQVRQRHTSPRGEGSSGTWWWPWQFRCHRRCREAGVT